VSGQRKHGRLAHPPPLPEAAVAQQFCKAQKAQRTNASGILFSQLASPGSPIDPISMCHGTQPEMSSRHSIGQCAMGPLDHNASRASYFKVDKNKLSLRMPGYSQQTIFPLLIATPQPRTRDNLVQIVTLETPLGRPISLSQETAVTTRQLSKPKQRIG